jgi:predicted nuclease of restriction endonuclease-like (RecB) superfamily
MVDGMHDKQDNLATYAIRKLDAETSNNKLEIIKYQQLLQTCGIDTRQKQDLLASLKAQYNDLLAEVTKKRLQLDALRLKHMEQLQKDIEASTKVATSNVTESCGDSSQLAKEVKALIAEKEAKLSQAPKTVSRCAKP